MRLRDAWPQPLSWYHMHRWLGRMLSWHIARIYKMEIQMVKMASLYYKISIPSKTYLDKWPDKKNLRRPSNIRRWLGMSSQKVRTIHSSWPKSTAVYQMPYPTSKGSSLHIWDWMAGLHLGVWYGTRYSSECWVLSMGYQLSMMSYCYSSCIWLWHFDSSP